MSFEEVPKRLASLLLRIQQAPQFPSDLVQAAAEYAVHSIYSSQNGPAVSVLLEALQPFPAKQRCLVSWLKQAGVEVRRISVSHRPTVWDASILDRRKQEEAFRFAMESHFEGGATAIRLTEEKVSHAKFDDVIVGLSEEEFSDRFIYLAAQRAVNSAYIRNDCSEVKKLLDYTYSNSCHHEGLIDWLNHAGIHATPLMPYGPTGWEVFVRQRGYWAKALDYIKRTSFDARVIRKTDLGRGDRWKDDRERAESPGTSVHTVPGGGTGVGGRGRRQRSQ